MKRVAVLSGLFFFVLFVYFSYLVHNNVFLYFDFDTTVKLQDHIARRLDTLLSLLSLLGSFEFLVVILLIFLIVKRNLGLLILTTASFAGIHLFELFGKLFVRHPGPPFMFFRYDINFLFPSSYVQPGYSYPSGHSARTVFISVILLSFIFRSRMSKNLKLITGAIIILFDIGMIISRVYLGEHWTSDVIGGSILGFALSLFTISFF